MKIIFICSSYYIVYQIKFRHPINQTYDRRLDEFRIWILVIPTLILAFVFNVNFTPFEILWAFSIYLESVAILPQLIMVQKFARENQGSVQNITAHYVVCLGLYRAFYVANWFVRYYFEPKYYDPIAWISGVVQTALYVDFIYFYFKARYMGRLMELPV